MLFYDFQQSNFLPDTGWGNSGLFKRNFGSESGRKGQTWQKLKSIKNKLPAEKNEFEQIYHETPLPN